MGIDGTYNIMADTPLGRKKITLTMKIDGNSLCGSASMAMMGKADFSGGRVEGNSFEFEVEMSSPFGRISMSNSGNVEGDIISGEVKTSMGNMKYSGNRV